MNTIIDRKNFKLIKINIIKSMNNMLEIKSTVKKSNITMYDSTPLNP